MTKSKETYSEWYERVKDSRYAITSNIKDKPMTNEDPRAIEVPLRRLYTRFNELEALARSRATHPSNAILKEYAAKLHTEAATWAMAKELVKQEMLNGE